MSQDKNDHPYSQPFFEETTVNLLMAGHQLYVLFNREMSKEGKYITFGQENINYRVIQILYIPSENLKIVKHNIANHYRLYILNR